MSGFLDQFHPSSTIPALGSALGVSPGKGCRVLHLVAGNLYGGIERMLVSLGLNSHYCVGLENTFGVCFPGRLEKELKSCGLCVHEFGKASFRNPFSLFFARQKFRSFLSRHRFDWILCHGSWIHALFGRIIRKSQMQLAHMIHGISSVVSHYDRMSQRYPADLVIANSRTTLSTAELIFPGVPTVVVYPPCVLQAPACRDAIRNKLRQTYRVPSHQKVIFAASRMEEGKGLDILIQALGRLRENPKWICWVGGEAQRHSDQVYLKRLRSLAVEAKIASRIRWLGHVEDIVGHFAAADIYCQPNRMPESFGMTFVEAQSLGCPVITTAIGGAVETVERNDINILLEYPNVAFLVEALTKTLAKMGGNSPV